MKNIFQAIGFYFLLIVTLSGCFDDTQNLMDGDVENDSETEFDADITDGDVDSTELEENVDTDTYEDEEQIEDGIENTEYSEEMEQDWEAEVDSVDGDLDNEYDTEFECEYENELEEDVIPVTAECIQVDYSAPIYSMTSIASIGNIIATSFMTMNLKTDYSFFMTFVDETEPDKKPVLIDKPIIKVYKTPDNYFAAVTINGELLIYDPATLDTSTDPINEIRCMDCDFKHMCFIDDRAYWLSKSLCGQQRKLMSAKLDANGGFTMGSESVPFTISDYLETGYPWIITVFVSLYNIQCSSDSVHITHSNKLSRQATSTLLSIPVSSENTIGKPTILDKINVDLGFMSPDMLGSVGAHIFQSNNILISELYITTFGTPGPGSQIYSRKVHDLSTSPPTYLRDHELSLNNWITFYNGTIWTADPYNNLARHNLSNDMTMSEIGSFGVKPNIRTAYFRDDKAYVAVDQYGIEVVEIKEGSAPQLIFDKQLSMQHMPVKHIITYNNKFYIIDSGRNLFEFDKDSPFTKSYHVNLKFTPLWIIQKNNRIYGIAYDSDSILLSIVDLDQPQENALLYSENMPLPSGQAQGYYGYSAIDDNVLYTAHGNLYAISLSDPLAPEFLWEISPYDIEENGRFTDFRMMEYVNGNIIALTVDKEYGYNQSLVVFKSNGENEPTKQTIFADSADHITSTGNTLIIATTHNNTFALRTIDFSDAENPVLSDYILRPDIDAIDSKYGQKYFFTQKGYLIIVASQVHIVDLNNLEQDVYTITKMELNDIMIDNSGEQEKFWLALDSYFPPTAFIKVDLSGCTPENLQY